MHLNFKNKVYSSLFITISILPLLVGSCGPNPPTGVVTHTFTPSLTPTCLPVSLSTPEGWSISSHLFVILYDPRSTVDGVLGFANRETTQDVTVFLRRLVPELMNPGDQLAVFQLGYSSYEAAQVTRLTSYTTIPPLYNTPSPGSTLTPLPEPTIVGGFGPVQATNQAKFMQTQRAAIEEQYESEYNCQKKYWNENVGATASFWNITATAEVANLVLRLETDFTRFLENSEAIETPFRTNELYYGGVYNGLNFATRVYQSEGAGCNKYTSCTLVIIDDMNLWGKNNPENLTINLNNVKTYVVMPNCKDIDNTICQEAIAYWDTEFENFGMSASPQYWNGERAEINLLEAIRR